MAPNSGKSRTIQSDETLFDIIEHLREEGQSGVTEIARELSLSKSTVHGHLTSLKNRRYVVKTEKGYQLGMEFLNQGTHVQRSYDLYSIAHEKVTQLAGETGERVWCMVEENGMAYYLVGAKGQHPVHPPVRIGQAVHLHDRSAGKAILAHLPEEKVEEIINRYGLPATTPNTITSKDELLQNLSKIRERGYAINDSESLMGLFAIGAPIINRQGVVRGALTISGPVNRLKTEEKKEQIIELLLGATNELEINLINEDPNN